MRILNPSYQFPITNFLLVSLTNYGSIAHRLGAMDTHNHVVTTTTTTDMHHRIKGDSADGVALKYCTTVQEREILPPPLTPAHIPLLTCPESLAPPMFNSPLATIEPYTRKLLQRVLSSGESNVRGGSVTFHSALIVAGVDFTACDVQWRTHSIPTFTLHDSFHSSVRKRRTPVTSTYKSGRRGPQIVYGHTTLKAPVLVRSPKLSSVGPG